MIVLAVEFLVLPSFDGWDLGAVYISCFRRSEEEELDGCKGCD